MPRTCRACSSSERKEIDKALATGESFRNIAERFAISSAALFRHKVHIKTPTNNGECQPTGTRASGSAETARIDSSVPVTGPVVDDCALQPPQRTSAEARRELFVRAYLKDLNGTRAAIAAGYSEKTAESAASRLLRNVEVKKRIEKLMARKIEKLDITADRVLGELARLGFSNMFDYIKTQPDGSAYVDLSQLTREQAAAIQEIIADEYTEGRGENARNVKRTRFKLADKRGSLELLGRYLKLFSDDKANVAVGLNVTVTHGTTDDSPDQGVSDTVSVITQTESPEPEQAAIDTPASNQEPAKPAAASKAALPASSPTEGSGQSIVQPNAPRFPRTRTGAAMAFLRGRGTL